MGAVHPRLGHHRLSRDAPGTATLIGLALALWNAPNPFGFYTFAVLFFARISAKLNLYLGVPRIHVDFLPEAL